MEASLLKANHLLLVASPPVSSAIYYIDLSLLAPYKPTCKSTQLENLKLYFFSLNGWGHLPLLLLIQYLERVLTFTIFISPFIHYSNYHNPDFNLHFFTHETAQQGSWKQLLSAGPPSLEHAFSQQRAWVFRVGNVLFGTGCSKHLPCSAFDFCQVFCIVYVSPMLLVCKLHFFKDLFYWESERERKSMQGRGI